MMNVKLYLLEQVLVCSPFFYWLDSCLDAILNYNLKYS